LVTFIAMMLCMALAAAGSGDSASAADVARRAASKALGVPENRLQVRSVEAVQWPDSSLGCPQPGAIYRPVVTPGYRVVLEADGRTHTVHVARNAAVLCDRLAVGGPLRGAMAKRASETARRDAAARLGIDPQQVQIRSVSSRVFPDASLGCPQPGSVYAQVETPGFVIELEAAGKTVRYHADATRVVQCDEGE
jgi:hypothetical protein